MSKEIKQKKFQKLGNYEIVEAAKKGEIHKVYELYKKGNYPKDAILIGMPLEIPENGSIGRGAMFYFMNLSQTDVAKKYKKTILPIPLNSFYLNRIGDSTSKTESLAKLNELVKNDIKNLDGIVIPGDKFNFPPIKESSSPYNEILKYDGQREIHDEMTIYGLSGKEFYEKFPNHKINPNYESLHYEAELVKLIQKTDKIIMTSCHGTQLYAIVGGAKMLAGIEGHKDRQAHETTIKPNTQTFGYLGDTEKSALHIHTLALNPEGMPSGLEVVGKCGKVVEIIEETKLNKPYYGFQSHPEFIKNHPALENFVASVIQRNFKNKVLNKINKEEKNSSDGLFGLL